MGLDLVFDNHVWGFTGVRHFDPDTIEVVNDANFAKLRQFRIVGDYVYVMW
jgi:hypothetical protein